MSVGEEKLSSQPPLVRGGPGSCAVETQLGGGLRPAADVSHLSQVDDSHKILEDATMSTPKFSFNTPMKRLNFRIRMPDYWIFSVARGVRSNWASSRIIVYKNRNAPRREFASVQYNARNSAAVKLVTKASRWRKIGTRGRGREGRGPFYLRIASFAGNSERQSFLRWCCPVLRYCTAFERGILINYSLLAPSSSKERRSPEQDESRSSPTLAAPAPPSPQNNGTNESSSPPLNEARGALQRLKRFLSALQQFAADVGGDAGERVRHHIYSLVSYSFDIFDVAYYDIGPRAKRKAGTISGPPSVASSGTGTNRGRYETESRRTNSGLLFSRGRRYKSRCFRSPQSGSSSIEEFQSCVQECTNYPLRASVPGFLRALLPHAQRDLTARARAAKMTPLQYIRAHEHLILEPGGDSSDIFSAQAAAGAEPGVKRRASDPLSAPTPGAPVAGGGVCGARADGGRRINPCRSPNKRIWRQIKQAVRFVLTPASPLRVPVRPVAHPPDAT
ncbi:Protein CBFA2T2 [Eumeta japonica]|uniref:Protein CBFA2T2 n=1 Tax=Eumeta variegata TaxID=151549 RepID=A0A4C1UCM5_EUMVA|nr:Protein CBFA2T2 [Eumeta japonica]